ncbi:hypothetical protein ACFL47_01460 [Candidatus Latescibacterota bacterium]
MKKTYICLEPGEHHPALCVVEKHFTTVGRLQAQENTTFEVKSLESLPSDISKFDLREKVAARMRKYIMGNIRFILGYNYIDEETRRIVESSSLKPVKITVTGENEPHRDEFMNYVPYTLMVDLQDKLRSSGALTYEMPVNETGFIEDEDCELALCMAIWYASQDH